MTKDGAISFAAWGCRKLARNDLLLALDWIERRFLRFQPRLTWTWMVATYLPYMNASLAKKLKAIHVIANGHKLAEISADQIAVDASAFDSDIPPKFSKQELADPWTRIRGDRTSAFTLDFYSWTPKRRFASRTFQTYGILYSSRGSHQRLPGARATGRLCGTALKSVVASPQFLFSFAGRHFVIRACCWRYASL